MQRSPQRAVAHTRSRHDAVRTPRQEQETSERQSATSAARRDTPTSEVDKSALAELSRGSSDRPRIALTFDAGADSSPTPEILDALARHGVHATFFLTGKWIEKNPELARRIADEGHEIGNHTFSHRRLTELSSGDITSEIERTDRLLVETTGRSARPLARVPYGSRDSRVLAELRDLGYRSVYWDVDSWDSVKADITSDEIERRVLQKVRNGSVVLMHCGSKATADALDGLLTKLSDEGYQAVTVGVLAGE